MNRWDDGKILCNNHGGLWVAKEKYDADGARYLECHCGEVVWSERDDPSWQPPSTEIKALARVIAGKH